SGLTHVNIISNPVVQCKPVTIFLDANGNALLNPADVYDGTPVEGLDLLLDKNEFTCSDVGDNTVVLTVIDADGNESACSTIVSVADTLAPFITCAPDFTAFLNPFEEEYIIEGTDLNAVADDNCMTESLSFSINSGNIENATSVEGYKVGAGIHEVTWTATDNSNNVSVCSSVIKIEKRPTLVLVNKIELIEDQEIIYFEISLMDEILSEGIMGKTVH